MSDENYFWSRPTAEPKRSYKYLAKFANSEIPWFLVSSIDLPKADIGEATTHALNHTFKWPGRITWQDVSMEVTDSESLNAVNVLVAKLRGAGYVYPSVDNYATISKQGSITSFGVLTIQELNWEGKKIGEWYLQNAWVKKIDAGKKAYESDDVQKISLTVTYDWAEYKKFANPVGLGGSELPGPEVIAGIISGENA